MPASFPGALAGGGPIQSPLLLFVEILVDCWLLAVCRFRGGKFSPRHSPSMLSSRAWFRSAQWIPFPAPHETPAVSSHAAWRSSRIGRVLRFALYCESRRNYGCQLLPETRYRCLTSDNEMCNPCGDYTSDSISPLKFNCGETYSVFQSPDLQHWFKNWQELRRHKLTASTFGGAVGFWPRRRAQLWLEKIGAIEPFTGNMATCWSNIKDEEALERYKLITGNTVMFPEFQVYDKNNSEDDWLAASPDGTIDRLVYGLPSRGVLEMKCPFFDGEMSKAFPWSRVPFYCIPQAYGLMEIMDRDWMDFYVWTPKGSSLFRLYRDSEYWEILKIALSDFWWNHVQPARELYRKHVIRNPFIQLKSLRPARRHELCSYIVKESKRLANSSKLLMLEIDGVLKR